MIRVLIVDDAPLAREGIRLRLQDEPNIEVVGEAADGPTAVAAAHALVPDLIFLDVQMPGLDGFQVLERLADVHLPAVILVTAFESYAIKAFESHALDYLLKPIDGRRFRDALDRARRAVSHADELQRLHQRIADLLHAYGHESAAATPETPAVVPQFLTRVAVKDRNRFLLLNVGEVHFIESAGDYVRLNARGRSFLVRMTLSELERRLDPRSFARIHRSTIVNLDRVTEIAPQVSGDFDVVLNDARVLRMSRSYRDRLLS